LGTGQSGHHPTYATRERNLSHFYGGANVKQLAKGENPAWTSQQNGNDEDTPKGISPVSMDLIFIQK
jgi:hypothetical protein